MKHFYVIGNEGKPGNKEHMEHIREEIIMRGGSCVVHGVGAFPELHNPATLSDLTDDIECILILGGDGTLIRSASATVGYGIPLVGINFGTIGYLCDIDEQNIAISLEQIMQDDYFIEDRMMIAGELTRQGKQMTAIKALNDIVIYRAGELRVVNFEIYVNGSLLNVFTADGIIVATPTGSTGYSMSCGGPLIDPTAQMIVITPISPHTLNSRSVILNADDEIQVKIGNRHPDREELVMVSFDGDHSEEMKALDDIRITRAKETTKLLKLHKLSFLEVVSRKMQEND